VSETRLSKARLKALHDPLVPASRGEVATMARELLDFRAAAAEVIAAVDACRADCGDPDAECYLQDYRKDYHSLTKLRALVVDP